MAPIFGVILSYLAGSIPAAFIRGKLRAVAPLQPGARALAAN